MIGGSAQGARQQNATYEAGDGKQLHICHNRRDAERFPIGRELRYRLSSKRDGGTEGIGQTLNISSSGVLFTDTSGGLTTGKRIELSINWPARLDNRCHLRLVAKGRITRVEGKTVAVAIEQYEFRTAGRATQE